MNVLMNNNEQIIEQRNPKVNVKKIEMKRICLSGFQAEMSLNNKNKMKT